MAEAPLAMPAANLSIALLPVVRGGTLGKKSVVLDKIQTHEDVTYFEVTKSSRNMERLLCGSVKFNAKFRPLQHCRFLDDLQKKRNEAKDAQILLQLPVPPGGDLGLIERSPPKRKKKAHTIKSTVEVEFVSTVSGDTHRFRMLHCADTQPLLIELTVPAVASLQALAKEALQNMAPHLKHKGIYKVSSVSCFNVAYLCKEGQVKHKKFKWGGEVSQEQAFASAVAFRKDNHCGSDSDESAAVAEDEP